MSTHVGKNPSGKGDLPIRTVSIVAIVVALAVAAYGPVMDMVTKSRTHGMERLQQAAGSIEDAARIAASRP